MKWYGQIGFEQDAEQSEPGIWEAPQIVERNYYGDVLRNNKKNDSSQIVTDFTVSNQLSVLSDHFLSSNLHKIIYVTFMGSKWKVNSVEIQYPRIILEIGGVYKEESDDE